MDLTMGKLQKPFLPEKECPGFREHSLALPYMTRRNAVILFLIVLFGSCSKSADPAPTKEQLLSQSKGWIATAVFVEPAVFGTNDFYSILEKCIQDDIVFFTSAGLYRKEEGATKCRPTDPVVWDEGTWTFNADKSIITETSSTDGPLDYTVVGLTASELKLSQELTVDSVKYKLIFTSVVAK